jgi:bifunctional DNase/RNase
VLEMKVKAVTISQAGELTVLLTDKAETKVLPIVIGALEAQSIALPLQGEVPPRPMTHDLLKTVIGKLGGGVEKIVVTSIRENTYFAEIYLDRDGGKIVVDARPSDAIALAIRSGAPIFMMPGLVEFTYDLKDILLEDQGEGLH